MGSISWQNKNNIIWFLGSVLFCIANTEEKCKYIIYYKNHKCFLVLVIYMFVMFYFFFLQKAKKSYLRSLYITIIHNSIFLTRTSH